VFGSLVGNKHIKVDFISRRNDLVQVIL